MREDIKERWVKALRSGDYKQGVARLNSNGEYFCCLGVLCDLYSKEFNIDWISLGDSKVLPLDVVSNSVLDYFLPKYVQRWAELDSCNPNVPYEHTINGCIIGWANLASLNDSGLKFTEIADLVEKYL